MPTHKAAPAPKRPAITTPTIVIGDKLFVATAPWTGMARAARFDEEDDDDERIEGAMTLRLNGGPLSFRWVYVCGLRLVVNGL